MNFSSAYNPNLIEQKIYRMWEKSGYFNPDKLKTKKRAKSYVIVIPPPNITGSLHMGHGLNYPIQDILIRWKRLQGYKALMLPGTDHAGIATQNVVEKELKKEGKNRHNLGRKEFEERVWRWREKYGIIILEQLKRLGLSCDWSRTRFTMDAGYIDAVLHAFKHYFDKGLIYRGERVINWCPRCSTSLSDLELEYKEQKGKLWYIRYPLKNKVARGDDNFVVVATTRPETMLGDAAIAVNPKDERYKSLIGKTVILPIQNREITLVADQLVESEFGTGAVKVTPCHDLADFEIAERHNLPLYKVIGENGRMTKEAGAAYEGLTTLECRQKIVEELVRLELLEKIEDYTNRISTCYRCDNTVEPLLSKQWFLKMSGLAKLAIRAVKKHEVSFRPKRWEKVYLDWLHHTRDWCISRQLWWGHRLPIWQCQTSKDEKSEGDYFVSIASPKKCPICKTCKPKQAEDVLDTWFSSALWPFATLGWPKKTKDLKTYYPTQVLTTDRGIINLWVGRMVFSSYEFLGARPFRDVFIHATVLTREGKRMSKSLGTGIDPLELIEKYGADATRFGLIWQAMGGQDIRFAEEHFLAGKKFCNKLWNATRFVLTQIGSKTKGKVQKEKPRLTTKNLTKEDKIFLMQLDELIAATNNDLEKFRFGQALHRLYEFFWHTFCDAYLEQSKERILGATSQKEKDRIVANLLYGLTTFLLLLHPFLPFITEEIYQRLPVKRKTLLMIEDWPII